jgi:hypothetical protein
MGFGVSSSDDAEHCSNIVPGKGGGQRGTRTPDTLGVSEVL